jgi:glutamate--cysteine ligase
VALKLAPLTTAVFANSPWYEGAPHGGVTFRGRVWLDVDPDRAGLLPCLFARSAGYDDYVEWALDVPMFLFKRHDKVVKNTGQTFRSFWKDGYEGHAATRGDWQMHVNTLFPEVRLKRTIEIRGADAQGNATRCALPAVWTGILYDEQALSEADDLTADYTHDELTRLRSEIWKLGLRASFRGEKLQSHAERFLAIAEGGLERRAIKRPDGRDERVHLAHLKKLVVKGMTPADQLLEGMAPPPDFRAAVMQRSDLLIAP